MDKNSAEYHITKMGNVQIILLAKVMYKFYV